MGGWDGWDGFTCKQEAKMVLAEVKVPPFTEGKKTVRKKDIDWSREFSTVRIYVERVIELLKQKYTILQGVLPIYLIIDEKDTESTVDKIIHVCCACVNLYPSVVCED